MSSASSSPTPTTTADTSLSAPTGGCGSGWATAARAAIPRTGAQDPDGRLGKMLRLTSVPRPAPEIVAVGLAQPVALQLRPQDGRPLDRRRRAGRDRGDRPLPATRPRARQLRLGRVRGPARSRRSRSARAASSSPSRSTPTHSGCSVTGGYVYRGKAMPGSRAATSTGTTAAGRSGASRPPAGKVRVEPVRVDGLTSFDESLDGELYAVALGGTVYRFRRSLRAYPARRRTCGDCPSAAYATAFSESLSARSSRLTWRIASLASRRRRSARAARRSGRAARGVRRAGGPEPRVAPCVESTERARRASRVCRRSRRRRRAAPRSRSRAPAPASTTSTRRVAPSCETAIRASSRARR